ncbi:MAG TPA: DUF4412 domain-containing protein [Candidatus Limnocylindrales bacterium]|nr:DUF4412 domain-containing protein [Candidatus Limnocylindrales bacterium]
MFQRRIFNLVGIVLGMILWSSTTLTLVYSGNEQPAPSNHSTTSTASTASPVAQGSGEFEGVITMKMNVENRKETMEMIYFLKDRHIRIETKAANTPEGQAVMLWDLEAAKMTTLIPSKQMYMTLDLKETVESLKGVTKDKEPATEEPIKFPKLTPTGKQETIAGYPCEHWLMGDQQEIDICVAKGLGYFGMGNPMGRGGNLLKNLIFDPKLLTAAAAHPEWVKFLQGGAFPLKLTKQEDGKTRMTLEVTKIERKSLSDALFTVPPGYKEFNMQNIMGNKLPIQPKR